jgi:GAF domain-containing protein
MQTVHVSEEARLEALRQFDILDTSSEQAFDDLAKTAATICKTPIALIEFVDKDRVWCKAKIGLDLGEIPREHSFSSHAILENDVLIVPDASADERFAAAEPAIAGQPIRFYAGMPLVTHSGQAIGTLCVLDRVPRELTRQQTEWLRILSKQVVSQLERRLNAADLARVNKELEEHTSEFKATEAALRQRAEDLRQLRTHQDELEAARTVQLAGVLEQLQREVAERTQAEAASRRREDELRELRTSLEEMMADRTAELARVNELLQQEIAARRHAEEVLLQREGEWNAQRTHFEGVLAERANEVAQATDQLQQEIAARGHAEEVLLQREGEWNAQRTHFEGVLAERANEVAQATDRLQQESAARRHAEEVLLQRETEWKAHQAHLEGVLAERASEVVQATDQLQQEIAARRHAEEVLLQSEGQLRQVGKVVSEMSEGLRRELERCVQC